VVAIATMGTIGDRRNKFVTFGTSLGYYEAKNKNRRLPDTANVHRIIGISSKITAVPIPAPRYELLNLTTYSMSIGNVNCIIRSLKLGPLESEITLNK